MENIDPDIVHNYLTKLQNNICEALQQEDGHSDFHEDRWDRPNGGGGRSRVMEGGKVFEKAGINFSDVHDSSLPPSATAQRPKLAGVPYRAMGVSLVCHPLNPHVPTTHMNVRFFYAEPAGSAPVWWFGGGFDMTPYYGNEADAVHWHRTAHEACKPFGKNLYPKFKQNCDRYFFLQHRDEPRGIGGIFYDDFNGEGFEHAFAFTQSVGDHFVPAYQPIVARRKKTPYTDRERQFQLYRRGRYAEFNLVCDRGTLFGLQSKGRTESILMSLPPLARWDYDWHPEPDSPESTLYEIFLKPKDWLNLNS